MARAPETLIGRTEELAALEDALADAVAGRPGVVLLLGEAGIGKTRLLAELSQRARANDVTLATGRGHESLRAPLWPFVELLSALAARAAERRLPVPDLPAALLGQADAARAAEAEEQGGRQRAQLALAACRFVLALARHGPLLLLLDDAHWFDRGSLELLSQLVCAIEDARRQDGAALLLVVASRAPGGTAADAHDAALAATLSRMRREPVTDVRSLGGLDAADTMNLLEALGLGRPSAQLTGRILEATAGNPLFVRSLAEQLHQSGRIERVGGLAVSRGPLEELTLPSDVTGSLSAQLAQLAPQVRQVLQAAALLGHVFELELLAQVAACEQAHAHACLQAASGVVRAAAGRFEFAHPLHRHLLAASLTRQQRESLHHRIALALEAQPLDASRYAMVYHAVLAGGRYPAERLREHAQACAGQALALCAWHEAGEAFAAAAAATTDPRRRAALQLQAGIAFARDSDHAPSGEQLQAALRGYQALGDLPGVARVQVERARAALFAGALGELRDLGALRDALDALGDAEPALRSALLSRMADAYFYALDPERGQTLARDALASAEAARDHAHARDAATSLALNQVQCMQLRDAADMYAIAIAHAQELARHLETMPRVRHAGVLHMLGELDAGCAEASEALDCAEHSNDVGELALARAQVAQLEASRGGFDEVERQVREVLRLRGRLRAPWAMYTGVPALAYARFLRGRFREASTALQALDEPGRLVDQTAPGIHMLSVVLCDLIAAESGLVEKDADHMREGLLRYASKLRVRGYESGALQHRQ